MRTASEIMQHSRADAHEAIADELRAELAAMREALRFIVKTGNELYFDAETLLNKAKGIAEGALKAAQPARFDLTAYLERQWAWSKETFGPDLRTKGVVQHIRKELTEIEQEPHDLSEWCDVIILAMDGFWRHGGSPADLSKQLQAKQDKNMARTWPDWRTMSVDQAIEHDRSGEAAQPAPVGEPVGWLYELGADRQFHKTRQHYPGNWVEQMGYSVTPLYAAPGEHS